MNTLDSKSILAGQRTRGVPAGVIVGIVLSSVCLTVLLLLFMLSGILPFALGLVLALITLVPMLAGVLALDRLEPEPLPMLILAFLWGAGVSVAASLIFEVAGSIPVMSMGAEYMNTFSTVVLAPVFEELTKGLLLFGLLKFRKGEINGVTDGIVYASVCALGFAAVENIGYYISSGSSVFLTFIVRGILKPFGHPVYTSLTGIGVAAAAKKTSGFQRFLLPFLGLLGAIALHAMWNGASTVTQTLGLGPLLIVWLVEIAVLVVMIVAVVRDRRQTIRRITETSVAYLPTGILSPSDVEMLSSVPMRKKARAWARSVMGSAGYNAMNDFQQACTELTMLHDRANARTIDPAQFEERRAALVWLARTAKQALSRASAPRAAAPAPYPAGRPAGQPPQGWNQGPPRQGPVR